MTASDHTATPGAGAPSEVDVVHDPARVVEAILMVASDPVSTDELAQILERPSAEVAEVCRSLAATIAGEERGFVLIEVAGGWRFQSHPDLAPYIERWVLEGQSARLSAAALETLAIVAYKQPISRAQVASIRGVSVDGVVRTLEQRGYITEVARDPGPGQAVLFGTTAAFLEKLGLASLADLPPVAEFVPDASVVEQLEDGLRPRPLREPEVNTGDDAGDPGPPTSQTGVEAAPEPGSEPGQPGSGGLHGATSSASVTEVGGPGPLDDAPHDPADAP